MEYNLHQLKFIDESCMSDLAARYQNENNEDYFHNRIFSLVDKPQQCIPINEITISSQAASSPSTGYYPYWTRKYDIGQVPWSWYFPTSAHYTIRKEKFCAYKFVVDTLTVPVFEYYNTNGGGGYFFAVNETIPLTPASDELLRLAFALPATTFTNTEISALFGSSPSSTNMADTIFGISKNDQLQLNISSTYTSKVWVQAYASPCTTQSMWFKLILYRLPLIIFIIAVNNKDICITECLWSEWSSWSICSASCGTGVQERTRTYNMSNANCFQNPCPQNTTDTRSCVLSKKQFWLTFIVFK